MGYQTASTDDVESVIDEEYGGMWFMKDALGTEEVGLTVLELEPGAKGKEHDHGGDGQEEVYCVVDGEIDVDFADETVTLDEGDAVRIDAGETRQIHNRGEEQARLVLAGAPLS
ncbi:cupin domain-containing protein [Halorientalis salina]|uniref:cupin domain-containing protein n=1 Tax=Halorientalis salina TaxID=2932266 RepID=UPI0010AC5C0F|nr:cupin domain-containing protein [Halorientalis salina]